MVSQEDFVNIHALRRMGKSYSQIGRELNIDRRTVKAKLESRTFPKYPKVNQPTILTPFQELIRGWLLNDERQLATRIFKNIKTEGYTGGYGVVKRFVAREKAQLEGIYPVRDPARPAGPGGLFRGNESRPVWTAD